MTLIIGVTTKDFAVLLADRRIVDAATRRPMSEFHGKVMAHPWAGGWASAGLAHIGRESAIRWFKKTFDSAVLPGMGQDDVLNALGQAVSARARGNHLMQQHALMFGGVAFMDNARTGPHSVPVTLLIAKNILRSSTGEPAACTPSGTFRGFVFAPLPGRMSKPFDSATLIFPAMRVPEQRRLVHRTVNAWRKRADEFGPLALGFALSAAMDQIANQYEAARDAVIGPGRLMTIVEPGGTIHFAQKQANAADNQLEVESFKLKDHVVVNSDRWGVFQGWSGVTVRWAPTDSDLSGLRQLADGFYATFDPDAAPLPKPPEALVLRP